MELFGIRLVGFNTATGHKALLTIGPSDDRFRLDLV